MSWLIPTIYPKLCLSIGNVLKKHISVKALVLEHKPTRLRSHRSITFHRLIHTPKFDFLQVHTVIYK